MKRKDAPITPVPLTRSEKAHKIVFQKGAIRRIDDKTYSVLSQSGNGSSYVVISTPQSGWRCSCPDATYRRAKCKHALAVELSFELRKEVQETSKTIIVPVTTLACRFCNSDRVVKDALRKNKYGNVQRYRCRVCNKRFSFNIGFERMHASPQIITTAMQLYFGGESFRNMQKFIRLQGLNISHQTVYNWIQKYVGLMKKYLDKITPNVSGTWRTDELFLKVKGDTKYLYAIMDDSTRFWIAQQVADTKYTEDIRPMFKDAKELVGKKPETIISDGAMNFHNAYIKEYRTMAAPRTQHIRHIHLEGDHNNNKMERMNGEIRHREKVMRGVKKMDTPILTGYQLYHNYFREHEGLNGKTPAEIAGIKIEGDNKWITIIQNAKIQSGSSE
jgi:putative transposase